MFAASAPVFRSLAALGWGPFGCRFPKIGGASDIDGWAKFDENSAIVDFRVIIIVSIRDITALLLPLLPRSHHLSLRMHCKQPNPNQLQTPPPDPGRSWIPADCAPGTLSTTSLATCDPCPAGSHCPGGLAQATPCPRETFCPAGSGVPTPCPPGTAATDEGAVARQNCSQCLGLSDLFGSGACPWNPSITSAPKHTTALET